ncbi:MAG: carboxypeptidase-like regulatory domain-containing protein [bacterium]|nr:carboxypeptidase-like regulatory domain-containing protein [bacterium]
MTTPDRLLTSSPPTPESRPVDELFDALLREEFGSDTPPDLADTVRAAWHRDRGQAAANRVLTAKNATGPQRAQRWLAAALVLLGLGVVTATFFGHSDSGPREPGRAPAAATVTAAPTDAPAQDPQKNQVQQEQPKDRGAQEPQPANATPADAQGAIHLRVVDRHGGPVQDFELRVVRVVNDGKAANQFPALRLPDQDRRVKPRDFVDDHVRIAGLAPASYRVIITAPPHARTVSPAFRVTAAKAAQQLTVTLARGATVTGIIHDATGKPVADAEVRTGPDYVQPRGPTPFQQMLRDRFEPLHTPATVKTDAKGQFRLTPLAPGRYSLVIAHPEHCEHEQRGLFFVDGPQELPTVRLSRGTIVHGQATFDGKAKAGIRVRIAPVGLSVADKLQMQGREVQTNADGKFRFAPLRPGSYKIQASHQTERKNPFEVLLQLRDTEQTIVLEADQRQLRCDVDVPGPRN